MGSNNSEDALFEEVGSYYFNNEKLHDVQFFVGEQQEKIKAVKLPLINQSKALWSMLSEDSPLMEKGDIYLPDIDPEVFTLLLKHSYGGLENLDDLSDDVVIKLCYCANKYFMKSLMSKIATHLQPKDVGTVFPALHCLAYYNLRGVEDGVKKVVQTHTKKIFKHPEFLECDVDSITYICKQDALNCDELALWKAVVNWATHRAQGDEGPQLRQWMSQPLQHIRLLTLTEQDLFHKVFSSGILSGEEIANICQQNTSKLSSVSNEKSVREYIINESDSVTAVNVMHSPGTSAHMGLIKRSCCCIFTKSKPIKLKSILFKGYVDMNHFTDYRDYLFRFKTQFDITIEVSRITDLMKNSSQEEPVTIKVNNFKHFTFEPVSIPTVVNNKEVTLEANSKYKVELDFDRDMPCWKEPDCVDGHNFDHCTFHCSLEYRSGGVGVTPCHIFGFTYGVADDESVE